MSLTQANTGNIVSDQLINRSLPTVIMAAIQEVLEMIVYTLVYVSNMTGKCECTGNDCRST